ncbi:MAG: hypothetical protein U1E83_08495 [Methylotetracoccus sp.]
MPKSAGTSFRVWLDTAFGAGLVLYDYTDRPLDPTAPMNVDPQVFLAEHSTRTELPRGIEAVHGHFWARKYERIERAFRMTFVRCPVERTISHYFYWIKLPLHGHALHRRVVEDGYDLLSFASLPEIRRCYTRCFFRDVDMSTFDFIGDYARLDAETLRLETILGRRGTRAERNSNQFPGYDEQRAELLGDAVLTAKLRAILADDIRFYETHAGT